MSHWQDIETVQDAYNVEDGLGGTSVLLSDNIGVFIGRVFFDGTFEGWESDGDRPDIGNVTHWMPLPPAPEAKP